MELLMEQLKRYRQEMDGRAKTSANSAAAQSQSPAMALSCLAQELEKERLHRKKSGLSGRREDRLWLCVRIMLEEYAQQMRRKLLRTESRPGNGCAENSWSTATAMRP